MNTAVINTVQEKHNFESTKLKDVAQEESDVKNCDKNEKTNKQILTKEDPPALHVLSDTAIKTVVSNTNSVTQPSNVKTRMVPLVYIQTPANLKVPTSSTGNTKTNPQIIVNANTQFQLSTLNKLKANTTMSSVVLTQTGNNKSQPIILQKSASNSTAQTLIPVTVATSTGTKQTFAYLGTIIKPPGGKTSENQIVVPTSHLPAGLVPAPTNQKFVIAPMTMPKLAPRVPLTSSTTTSTQPKLSSLILPMTISNLKNQSVINFKISNGQIQSDPKGSITVLCDNKSTEMDKEKTEDTENNEITIKEEPCDKDESKTLKEQIYELSIPEVSTSTNRDKKYKVSLSEDEIIKPSLIKRSKSTESSKDLSNTEEDPLNIPITIIKSEPHIRKPSHEISILKKCNLNSIKSNSKSSELTEVKTESVETSETTEQKPEVRKVNPERRRKSQYTYLRDFDEVVLTSGNAWENKNNHLDKIDKLKQFQSPEITFTKLPCTDEDTKENIKKSLNDIIEIELVNQEKQKQQDFPQFATEDDRDIKGALKWKDGIGALPGSKLKFHVNEFGLVEMLMEDEIEKFRALKKEEEPLAGDEILRCSECGCYGMPSEFVSRNYCSKTCKLSAIKSENKRAYLQEVKAKRKKKKMEIIQKHKNEEFSRSDDISSAMNSTNSDDDNNSNDMLHDIKYNYPWQGGKKGFSWSKYLDHVKAKAAPVKLFKDPFPYVKNCFRPGMKLEGIDPQHPSYFCVMTVSEVQGYRIRLHFDGYPENYDFWVNADSMDIFPIGWCEKNNHVLHPPPTYSAGTEFNWTSYLKQCRATAAPRQLFAHRSGNSVCPNGFRLGMKLEAVDKKNTSLVCVATVTDLMDNRFLVHFDSWDDIYDYWADPTSPYIHPVGWCDQYGHNLTPPNENYVSSTHNEKQEQNVRRTNNINFQKLVFRPPKHYPDPESFTWEKYLKETKSVAAPVRAFKQRPCNGFKRDMRLECVDKRVPSLIRVSTVEDVRDHQIKIRFDGWPNKYSFWIDDDSPDIHPAGWCQKTGHRLESPLTPEDVYENYECPTVGCRGQGHVKGSKYTSHNTSKDCPYSDENLDGSDIDNILPDRLNIIQQNFIAEAVVPVSREPKDKMKSRLGRPPKIRRLTETTCKPEWPMEDDLQEPRKRKLSNREDMTASEFNDNKSKITIINNDYPQCPSQQVLAKHTKILNEIISTNSQDARTWSQEEVSEFVSSLPSCKEHSALFVTHKIDGEAFLMLTQKDLVDILKFKLGPAIKLYNSIVLLRQNVNFYN